jgi:hypothetical protein
MSSTLRTTLTLAVLALTAPAQVSPAPPVDLKVPSDLRMSACLYQAWQQRQLPLETLRDRVGRGFVAVDGERRIHVEILAPEGSSAVPDALVRSFGGVTDTRWRNRLDAWIPLDRLLDLARTLPADQRIVRANCGEPCEVQGEGPMVTGSAAWRNGGANGAGIRVAVIDSDFANLSMAISNGDAPAGSTWINYTSTPFQDSDTHGTDCTENVFDHAPGSSYRLYKYDSAADLGSAIENCIAEKVKVISFSQALFNEGWSDDEGVGCDAATDAAEAGILFFTAAGNQAERHWQGNHNPGPFSPDWHDWISGDEDLAIQVPAGMTLNLYLAWNDNASGTDDYDLYLYDASAAVVASSASILEYFEDLSWTNSGSSTVTVYMKVYRYEGSGTAFEVFGSVGTWEYVKEKSSTVSPANTTHPNVISVGAVDRLDYLSAPGTSGIITPYSSQGPTNGGMKAPTVVGPVNITGFSSPGGFNGTSAATPNAAGVAACLWSSVPIYSSSAIRWLLLRQAQVFKDWGSNGVDDVYGNGAVNLVSFAPNTRWLVREYNNTANLVSAPSYTLPWAMGVVPAGGRVLAFPGGHYPEHPIVLDEPMILDSAGGTAIFD